MEIEQYVVDLDAVSVLELAIQPDISRREAVGVLPRTVCSVPIAVAHSLRRMRAGSTRIAFRAGVALATSATIKSRIATPA